VFAKEKNWIDKMEMKRQVQGYLSFLFPYIERSVKEYGTK